MKKKGWETWKRDVTCVSCKQILRVTIDDLYADDTGDGSGRLMVCVTCIECGSVVPVRVSDIIKNMVLTAV